MRCFYAKEVTYFIDGGRSLRYQAFRTAKERDEFCRCAEGKMEFYENVRVKTTTSYVPSDWRAHAKQKLIDRTLDEVKALRKRLGDLSDWGRILEYNAMEPRVWELVDWLGFNP